MGTMKQIKNRLEEVNWELDNLITYYQHGIDAITELLEENREILKDL